MSCKGWNLLTDIVCLHALHLILWMNCEVMVVASEQWIGQSVLAKAIGVPVPAPFVAVAISVVVAIALLAMVTMASTLHLLLEATQSIERGMSECMSMAGSSFARACTVCERYVYITR